MSHTARVGVFMLAALVILGVFIIKIEEIPIGTRGGRTRVKAAFPSVAGLDEKSAVRVAGVRVGIVETIALDGSRALATLALDPGVQIHQGAHAEVTSLGMLGDKYVELFPGDPAAPLLPSGTILRGTSPISFDQLLKTANDVGGDVKAVTASLRDTLGGAAGQKRLDEIIDNVRQLTATVRDLVQANRTNVDATLANFRSFSDSLKTELPRFADKLVALADHIDAMVVGNRGNIDASLGNVKELSAQLRVSADNLNKITGKIASGEGTVGKLINDETTVNNLNDTLKSVENGVQSLRNTIGRAERWSLFLNVRSEALPSLPSTEAGRTAFGFDLHTIDTRFYRIELVSTPFGATRRGTETITTTFPDGSKDTVVQVTNSSQDTYTVNAQVAYLMGDLTLRTGLFESKGGVGVDKLFFKKKLQLTLETYDWLRETKPPHIRLEGRYYLNRNLFGYVGWDDPRWSQRSSMLFGAGITWKDEDVKYLLGTAASLVGH